MQGGIQDPLAEEVSPLYQQLALSNWQRLAANWTAMKAFVSGDSSTYQSSWRFLLRAMLAPAGVLNDHLDYKLILRTHTFRPWLAVKPVASTSHPAANGSLTPATGSSQEAVAVEPAGQKANGIMKMEVIEADDVAPLTPEK